MTDWPAYLLVPALVLHYGWYEKNNRLLIRSYWAFPLFSLAMLCLFVFFSYLSDPQNIGSVINQGMTYMGLIGTDSPLALRYTEAAITFTPMQFIKQTLGKIDGLYAYPIVLMALFGAWFERNERDAMRHPGLDSCFCGLKLLASSSIVVCIFIYGIHTISLHRWQFWRQ